MDNKDWFSTEELAGLPGMPGTVQGIRLRAIRERWPSRKRQGRGGGREYPLSCLPMEAQAALFAANGSKASILVSQAPTVVVEVLSSSISEAKLEVILRVYAGGINQEVPDSHPFQLKDESSRLPPHFQLKDESRVESDLSRVESRVESGKGRVESEVGHGAR